MRVTTDLSLLPFSDQGSVVTVGAYDGMHLGHRAVVAEVRRLAAERELRSVVVTFDRHPASVVRPESAPKLLTGLEQRLELLAETGVDETVVIHFDQQRSTERAEDFVLDVLVRALGVRCVVVGEDFHFGKDRRGNVDLLRTMGLEYGFTVEPLALVGRHGAPAEGRKVSSTAIRQLLADGNVAEAATLLGRPHEVRGAVQHGDERGRLLGFPTANVGLDEQLCLPAQGTYAGWYLRPDGVPRPCAINLGRRPTFYVEQKQLLLEAHLLDWSGTLYDEMARVRFVARLRGEQKFESVDALREQLSLDIEAVRDLLGIE